MSKKFLGPFLIGLSAITCAVLWLLHELKYITFSPSWAVVIVSATCAVVFICKGLFGKNVGVAKKFSIYLGAGMGIITVFALISAIALPKNLVLPIIAIIVTAALLLGFVAVGGKKWDQGDNQNVGYKNYYQRKAEEEKRNKENQED